MAAAKLKFPGISDELSEILDAKMDEAPARRRAREAFKDIQLNIDHILLKATCDGLKTEERATFLAVLQSYEVNSRGVEIFCKSWLPETSQPKGLVCYCHGTARKLASSGYGVFAMDYPGFGLSAGLHGYIPSFDRLVDDVIEHYSKVKEYPEFRTLPSFLFGQSLGGAVALKVHLKQPNAWSGAILVAPMCKIADDMVPPFLVKQILIGIANILPKHKLVPQKDLAEAAFRDLKNRELAKYNVIVYKDKPRLRTALELLKTTEGIEHENIIVLDIYWIEKTSYLPDKVSLPLLILHGENDTVTDPSVSKALYEKASSKDKKCILYKDAFHSLLEGEPDDMIIRVFADIISWLDDHSRSSTDS
ncbi:Hydrolase 4 domain-containing protein [Citrus sinensis]|uniref:Hydrolase 4 domain-containing protein n=1 Tax=Citrus sinensis TaxID=2711 RepID=A0ACB8K3D8_CITSI|nr:Hydrolase 4 domain-containing protein [Citrus sinensis]